MADVADVLGISEHIARRHYAKWSAARQERIATIMRLVQGAEATAVATAPGRERVRPVIQQFPESRDPSLAGVGFARRLDHAASSNLTTMRLPKAASAA